MCWRFQKSKSPLLTGLCPSVFFQIPCPCLPSCPSIWVLVQPLGHFTPQQRAPGTAPQGSDSNPGRHHLLLLWAACANKHLLPTYAPWAASVVWNKMEGIIEGELENAERPIRGCSISWAMQRYSTCCATLGKFLTFSVPQFPQM